MARRIVVVGISGNGNQLLPLGDRAAALSGKVERWFEAQQP